MASFTTMDTYIQRVQAARKPAGTKLFVTVAGATVVDLSYFTSVRPPAAFFVPTTISSEPNQDQNEIYQETWYNFTVIVILNNTVDERGQDTATQAFDEYFWIMLQMLLYYSNPNDDRSLMPLEFVSAVNRTMNRAQNVFEYNFRQPFTITTLDGDMPTGIDITKITIDTNFSLNAVIQISP
jgi:hypothetical protein